jgi:hypothetical protein
VISHLSENNLLVALSNYAHQQEENFTTEAFVHLLRHVQRFEPTIACSLICSLSGGRLNVTSETCSKLEITTQSTFAEGRPDILIESPTEFAMIVEVKVRAGPGETQFDRTVNY